MDLDETLELARPVLAERAGELSDELDRLVLATRPAASRRRHRLMVVGGVTAGLLGAGAAGAAAGILPWPTWGAQSPTGTTCKMEFHAHALHRFGGQAPSHPISDAEQDRVAAEARRILDRMDFDAIDVGQAIRAWRKAEARTRADQISAERQPVQHGDDLTQSAMYYAVTQRVVAELRVEGLDPEAVTFGAGSRCSR